MKTVFFVIISVCLTLSITPSTRQSFHRHCHLPVTYPNGKCLRIQNQNLTRCPQLNDRVAGNGFVLGYCDVFTVVEQKRDRVPELLVRRKCLPECVGSCAATGFYWCKQIWTRAGVVVNGTETEELVESDCLCVKNVTEVERIISLYDHN